MLEFERQPIKKHNKGQQSEIQVVVLILRRVAFEYLNKKVSNHVYLIPLFYNFSDPVGPYF